MNSKSQLSKKILAAALAIALAITAITMLPASSVSAAKRPELNKKKVTIYVGRSMKLKVKNAKGKVKWTTSNKKVASVSKKGKVKGKKPGKAVITAKVKGKKLRCKVTVKKKTAERSAGMTSEQVTKPSAIPQTAKPGESAAKKTEQTTKPAVEEQSTEQPTPAPEEYDSVDVAALKKIIAQQRAQGATVSENIYDTDEYTWMNGRLVGIEWGESLYGGGFDLKGNLDLSGLTDLIFFYCFDNDLTGLDVSKNTELTRLYCGNNRLSSLDVSGCTELIILFCNNNQLSSLDISHNPALTNLYCDGNKLTTLDVSNNPLLQYFVADDGVTLIR